MAESDTTTTASKLVIIEPFYGGSHKQLVDLLCDNFDAVKFVLPAKKWHWRARTSALYFSQTIPRSDFYRVLFASSVLNLAELIALRPDLSTLNKILYFHENQLVYPVRKQQDRDFQYGYNQVLSCLVADSVLFNSKYNMESFLSNISSFMKLIPDHRPKGLSEIIRPKCQVLYFPLSFISLNEKQSPSSKELCPCDEEKKTSKSQQRNETCGKKKYPDAADKEIISDKISRTEFSCHGDGERGKGSYGESEIKHSSETCQIGEEKLLCTSDGNSEGKSRKMTNKQRENSDTSLGDNCTPSLVKHSVTMETDIFDESYNVQPLHIVWAHRWEHDKDPDTFFQTLYRLHGDGLQFHVSVLGESFTDVPDVFTEAKCKLADHILTWGYQANKGDYSAVLQSADVAVSTAIHEFFGVSMLEAVYCGCYPLCPDRLVYPEIFPSSCLYRTSNQLFKRLREFCRHPHLARKHKPQVDIEGFSWKALQAKYESSLCMDGINR